MQNIEKDSPTKSSEATNSDDTDLPATSTSRNKTSAIILPMKEMNQKVTNQQRTYVRTARPCHQSSHHNTFIVHRKMIGLWVCMYVSIS